MKQTVVVSFRGKLRKMYVIILLLFVTGTTFSVPAFASNVTNSWQYTVPDGGQEEIQCVSNITNGVTIQWEVFGKVLERSINSSDANFDISRNSSLIVTNPRNSSLQGLVNVTCITSSNSTNGTRTTYLVAFLKAPSITTNKLIHNVPDDGSTKATLTCEAAGFPRPTIRWLFQNVTLPTGNTYHVNTTDIPNANLTQLHDGRLEVMSANRHGGFGVGVVCSVNNTVDETQENFLVKFLKAPKILTTEQDIALPSESVDFVRVPCQTIGYPKPFIQWVLDSKVTLNATSPKLVGKIRCLTSEGYITTSYKVYENGSLLIDDPHCESQAEYTNLTCIATSILGWDTKSHEFSLGDLMLFSFEIFLANASQYDNLDMVAKAVEKIFENNKANLSLRSINVTSVNLTTGRLTFDLTWLEQRLKSKEYLSGENVITALVANDIRQALIRGGINVVSFLLNAKPGPPTDLSIGDVTTEEISLSWKKPNYFTVTDYQIQINDGGSTWKNFKKASGDETSFDLSGLDSGTKYLIRMQSINEQGTGLASQQVEAKTKDAVPVVIIVVVVILVVLVLVGVVLGVWYYRHRPTPLDVVVIPIDENPYFLSVPGVSNVYERDNRTFCPLLVGGDLQVNLNENERNYFSWREINRESLKMGDALGHGEFGMVMKAVWEDEQNKTSTPVAVKTIKENATETDRKELFKELKLMADISEHPNIVKMLGACSRGGPLWIVVELCEHGNLLNFLRQNRQETSGKTGDYISSLDPLLRVRIAYDVSKGMHYLEDKKIVHRDLAARNVLLGKNKIAKIADFGLSRDIYEQGTYEKKTGGKLPVKWMAIESLKDQTYDTKSDVWSYGVMFWEIEAAGMIPYPGVGGRDVIDFLLNGFRLEKPSETPFEIYEIMKKCWDPSPKLRPNFQEIESELEAYLEQRADYLPVMIEEDKSDNEEAYINYIVGVEDEEAVDTRC